MYSTSNAGENVSKLVLSNNLFNRPTEELYFCLLVGALVPDAGFPSRIYIFSKRD